MKAFILKKFGGPENFVIADIQEPEARPDEVLVRTSAIGINPIDIKTRKGGGMASRYKDTGPVVIGWDISGIVTKAGKNVKNFSIGDEVFGTINFPGRGCAYAEYVAAPADQIARKPSNISHTEAASATLSALTAWQALTETGKIKKYDKVLIHGAAGGVGNFAVQIARHFDACVTGTASNGGIEFVKSLGANEVIDYNAQRFEEITHGFDLILDTIGGENFVRSLKVLRPGGTIVLLPSDKSSEAEKIARENHVENYHHLLMHSSGKGMHKIAGMLADGSIKAYVDRIFPFEQLPEAHSTLENGKIKGKIVVTMP